MALMMLSCSVAELQDGDVVLGVVRGDTFTRWQGALAVHFALGYRYWVDERGRYQGRVTESAYVGSSLRVLREAP